MTSPWDTVMGAVTRLADRVDGLPTVREARVMTLSPLAVRFDTDDVNTLAHGTLEGSVGVGDRVLTLKLRHYVWVLGRRGGATPGSDVRVGGTIAHSALPGSFGPGITIGNSDASYPLGVTGTVEVVRLGSARTFQTVVYKATSAATQNSAQYIRSTDEGGDGWGPWVQVGGDTGWLDLTPASGWTGLQLAYRIENGDIKWRGEFYGGADLSTVFTMPSGPARPVNRLAFPVFRIASGGASPWGTVNIQTTGVATFINMSGGSVLTGSPGYSLGGAPGYRGAGS